MKSQSIICRILVIRRSAVSKSSETLVCGRPNSALLSNLKARTGVFAGPSSSNIRSPTAPLAVHTDRSIIMGFMSTHEAMNAAPFSSAEERWAAVVRRDKSADGIFYYSVRTTGVYCRPSCASRLALRKNVRFHASCEGAEQADFLDWQNWP